MSGRLADLTGRPLFLALALLLAGCAGRPEGNLIPVAASAPDATRIEMLVATTRAPVAEPAGMMFGGERAIGLNFADIVVSIPPDATRKIGEVQWPSSAPGDPEREFVTLSARTFNLAQARAEFDRRLAGSSAKRVLIFVHGYNTRFEEAVYRFAQITHDSGADVLPLLFTWPSRGSALAYLYDRESATYSRDALEAVIAAVTSDPHVGEVSILAHSMGNFVTVEALRQMAIRDRGLPAKIKDIMLASPDIDVDVFRREIAEIEKGGRHAPVTLFVSRDDRALNISRLVAGDEARLGSIDPLAEPYKSLFARANVQVVDLTQIASSDPTNHGKFASGDVVRAIGVRLASGQQLNDARPSVGEALGAIAIGATDTIGRTTATVLSGGSGSAKPAEGEAKPLTP